VLLAFLLTAAGCSLSSSNEDDEGGPSGPSRPLTFSTVAADQVDLTTIDKGDYPDLFSGEKLIIRNSEEYERMWNRIHADTSDQPERPEVDFSSNMIVAVVLGERPTTGYEVEVVSINQTMNPAEPIAVLYKEYVPGENCVVAQSITSPYHIVKVDKVDASRQLEFATTSTGTRSCN
jgi:hypothetical protein